MGENDERNSWSPLLSASTHPRKRDWMMSFYEGRVQLDGRTPLYPAPENDFAALFLKADIWDDGLEKALAFDLIGAHRVQTVNRTLYGESLPFLLSTNAFATIDVRPFFGRYGADMYFTA